MDKIKNLFKSHKIIFLILIIVLSLFIISISLLVNLNKNEIDPNFINNTVAINEKNTISIPFSSEECVDKNYEEIRESLKELGFKNIEIVNKELLVYGEKDKLDTIDSITINDEVFDVNQEFDDNSKIVIIYRGFKKCHVNIHINFIPNLFFNKYNVIFKMNNNKMGEIEHGVDSDYETDIIPGDLLLEFLDKDNETIMCKVTLEVTGNVNISYKLNCYSDNITVQQEYIEKLDDVKDNQIMVTFNSNDFKYKNYEEVKKTFEDLGFTNIKTEPVYDIIWGITSEGELSEVTIAGNKEFSRGDIFNNQDEVRIKYHMKEDSNPNKKVEIAAKPENKSLIEQVESTPQPSKEDTLNTTFPKETAKKALIVTITNDAATDVFTPDGNNIDKSKFHNYSNLKFKEQIDENQYVWFYYTLKSDGKWIAKDDSTWHVENIKYLQNPKEYGSIRKFSGDIHYDGTNYIVTGTVTNAAEKYIDSNDSSKVSIHEIQKTDEASIVTEELLK